MNVQAAYSHWSASYDSVANPTRDLDEWVMRSEFSGQRFARVLELGCGTGKNSALLAGLADQLVAMDFSPGMLDIARVKVRAPQVQFVAADITQPWPLDGASFDLITCNLVLEHVVDLKPVFAQARRCLRPEGRFFVSELHPFKQYLGSQARFQMDRLELKIPATIHHLTDYTAAAGVNGLRLLKLNEWWDQGAAARPAAPDPTSQQEPAGSLGSPPRLVSFLFDLLPPGH
jgi:ubiquinone/menaquinone biosynthesis C-methylase UbiE